MTCKELVRELEALMAAHPDAQNAQVWAYIHGELGSLDHFRLMYIGFDQRHRPARIKLEE